MSLLTLINELFLIGADLIALLTLAFLWSK